MDDGIYKDIIYLDTNGNYSYDSGDFVLEVVEGSRYSSSPYGSIPIGNYLTSLTLTLVQDPSSPAQDYYGNYAKFGQQITVR